MYAGMTTKTTNWRFLSTPVKNTKRTQALQRIKLMQRKITMLTAHVDRIANNSTSLVHDPEVHGDLTQIITDYDTIMQEEPQYSVKKYSGINR